MDAPGATVVPTDWTCDLCGEQVTLRATLAERDIDGVDAFFLNVEGDRLLMKATCGCNRPQLGQFHALPVPADAYE
jgi:hypothetical protein